MNSVILQLLSIYGSNIQSINNFDLLIECTLYYYSSVGIVPPWNVLSFSQITVLFKLNCKYRFLQHELTLLHSWSCVSIPFIVK